MCRDHKLHFPGGLVRIRGREFFDCDVQLIDEHFLHLRMQVSFWFFDEDQVRDGASWLCAIDLVVALQLQEHVNEISRP
ncbi:hypothetical protein D3C71_1817530 [compost metagenome]